MELKELTFEEIIKPEVSKKLLGEMNQVIAWQDFKACLGYIKFLDKVSNKKTLPKVYSDVIPKLKWIAAAQISDSELLSLVESDFDVALDLELDLEIDLLSKIKSHLLLMNFKEQEDFKFRISSGLEKSKNKITSKPLNVNGETTGPTIESWLADYRVNVTNKESDDLLLAKAEYLSNGKNIKDLNSKEKSKVKILLNIYDFVNTSVFLPGGYADDYIIEWPDGTLELLTDGYLEKIYIPSEKEVQKNLEKSSQNEATVVSASLGQISDSGQDIASEEQEILQAYKGDMRQVKAISKEAKKILSKFGSDISRLRAEFFAAVQKKNVIRTIALLRIMAQKQELEDFIANDQKLNKFLTSIWQKQYGDEFIREFSKKPDQLKFTRIFLRYILEQRLGMSPNDAARIGLQIANVFVSSGKKSYNKMAYFDVKTKTFNWLD